MSQMDTSINFKIPTPNTNNYNNLTAILARKIKVNRSVQMGFFDIAKRYAGLDAKNDPLVKIEAAVWWEDFRPSLEAVWRAAVGERKSAAGR